jgi:hypothetical protein
MALAVGVAAGDGVVALGRERPRSSVHAAPGGARGRER